jgi:hypothetical protein
MLSLIHSWWSREGVGFVGFSGAVYDAHVEICHVGDVARNLTGDFMGFLVVLQVGMIADHR